MMRKFQNAERTLLVVGVVMDGVAVCGDGGGQTKDVKEAKWRRG